MGPRKHDTEYIRTGKRTMFVRGNFASEKEKKDQYLQWCVGMYANDISKHWTDLLEYLRKKCDIYIERCDRYKANYANW